MNLSLDQWLRLVLVLVLVGSVSVNVFLFHRSRADQRLKEFDQRLTGIATQKRAMQTDLAAIGQKVAVHEARLAAVPTHRDLDEIRRDLTSVKATTAAIDERSETTLDTVQSIQRYLMEH